MIRPRFHPSSVIVVDDVRSYLDSLVSAAPEEIPLLPFVSPEEAIRHIQKQNEISRKVFNESLKVVTDTDRVVRSNRAVQEQILKFSFSELSQQINNPHRYDEISVIIADYSMPQMTGTEFFQRLGQVEQKRILLTGEADEKVATQAFNDGIIDQFVTKGQSGVVPRLFDLVQRYQRDYFAQKFQFLTAPYWGNDTVLVKPQFESLLRHLYATEGFVEHYFVNFPDGALLLDMGTKRQRLIALTDKDYADIIGIVEDDPKLAEFATELRARRVVPNDSYGRGAFGDFSYWREMCKPAIRFDDPSGPLYYALFDVRDEVDLDAASTFQDYMMHKGLLKA